MEDKLSPSVSFSKIMRFAEMPKSKTQVFDLIFPSDALREAAVVLDVVSLEKCRLQGTLAPAGKKDWVLKAHLGATAVQDCVVTMEPVKTRVEQDLQHRYTPQIDSPVDEPDIVIEMDADVDVEPLPESVDLVQIAVEALLLCLPEYPRVKGAELGTHVFTEAGIEPLRDEDLKPFAGLAALKAKLNDE